LGFIDYSKILDSRAILTGVGQCGQYNSRVYMNYKRGEVCNSPASLIPSQGVLATQDEENIHADLTLHISMTHSHYKTRATAS